MVRKNKKRINIKPPESSDGIESADSAERSEAALDPPLGESEALCRELAEVKDQFLRAKAEQQNVLRRATQERTEAVRYANANLIKDLLGIVDDFERTLEQSDKSDLDTVLEGVRLMYDNFCKVLKDERVEPINPLGAEFDPRYHEAVLQQAAPDKKPGSVIQVVQLGYRLDDRVLRPAKVIIAAEPQDEDSAEELLAGDSGKSDVPRAEATREQG